MEVVKHNSFVDSVGAERQAGNDVTRSPSILDRSPGPNEGEHHLVLNGPCGQALTAELTAVVDSNTLWQSSSLSPSVVQSRSNLLAVHGNIRLQGDTLTRELVHDSEDAKLPFRQSRTDEVHAPVLVRSTRRRRTCATHLSQHGGVKEVQAHLRRSRATTTLDVYVQEIPEAVREAVERLDAVLTTTPPEDEEGENS